MNEDKIIEKLLEHDEQLREIRETMFTKAEGERILQAIDNLTLMVKKIHEDHVFALEWVKRLQDKVDQQEALLQSQEEEIRKIKMKLQVA